MRRTAPFAFMALALLASSAAAQTQERAGLRWQLKQGDQVRYDLTWALDQKIDMGGQEIPQAMQVQLTLDQVVTSAAADATTLEATISAIKANVGMGPMGEMEYDSGAPADPNNPFAWVGSAIGKKFSFTMKPNGEVTSVTGADAIQEELTAVLQKGIEERMQRQGGGGGDMGMMGMGMDPAMLTSQAVIVFGDGSMKSALGILNHVLPDTGKAKEGDTYSRPMTETMPAVGTLTFTQQFSVSGAAGSAVRMGWKAGDDLKMERDSTAGKPGAADDPMKQMERAMMEKLEVKRKAVSGSASFDGGRSRLIDSEAVHEIDLEGPLPPMIAAMMGPEGKNAKMKQAIVITLRYAENTAGAAPAQPAPGNGGGKGGSF